MTNTIQHSIKLGDAILVIGGESWSDFCSNYIQAYGQDALDRLVDAFTIAVGGTDVMAQAVQQRSGRWPHGCEPRVEPADQCTAAVAATGEATGPVPGGDVFAWTHGVPVRQQGR
jgi:hypothetical protein